MREYAWTVQCIRNQVIQAEKRRNQKKSQNAEEAIHNIYLIHTFIANGAHNVIGARWKFQKTSSCQLRFIATNAICSYWKTLQLCNVRTMLCWSVDIVQSSRCSNGSTHILCAQINSSRHSISLSSISTSTGSWNICKYEKSILCFVSLLIQLQH